MFLWLRLFRTSFEILRDDGRSDSGNHNDCHPDDAYSRHDIVEENYREKFSEDDSRKLQTRGQQNITVTEGHRQTTLS